LFHSFHLAAVVELCEIVMESILPYEDEKHLGSYQDAASRVPQLGVQLQGLPHGKGLSPQHDAPGEDETGGGGEVEAVQCVHTDASLLSTRLVASQFRKGKFDGCLQRS